MSRGGIARRLINLAKVFVGMLPGGLALVHILASMLFGAISGSAVASSASIGGFMIPAMKKEGYDLDFSTAVIVTASTTGLIIPPKNIMIVYLCIGLCTPPVGSVLFVGCGISGRPISAVVKPLLPFFPAMILALFFITYIPELSLFLPRLYGY